MKLILILYFTYATAEDLAQSTGFQKISSVTSSDADDNVVGNLTII
jgi:hypothetical protein